MGINTITKGIIALFIIGIIYLSMTSTIVNLADDPTLFGGEMNEGTLFLRDNVLMIYYMSGIFTFFVIIVWMFSASSASGASSQFQY
ncbi:MAG: hypothetical protein ISR79_00360 [Nitrosopumilus sp.]|nr:hypothetical protein [Nitrosopumilus sp.]